MSSEQEKVVKKKVSKNNKVRSESQNSNSESDSQSSSDSSSLSDSNSSSSSSSSSQQKRKGKRVKPQKKAEIPKKVRQVQAKSKSKVPQSDKERWSRQLLKRWWYVMEPWPPAKFDYQAKLKEKGYRVIPIQSWQKEPEYKDGYMKAAPIQGYSGVFKTSAGFIDVRPRQGIPSYQNVSKLDKLKLEGMCRTAVSKQLEALKASGERNPVLQKELQQLLKAMKA